MNENGEHNEKLVLGISASIVRDRASGEELPEGKLSQARHALVNNRVLAESHMVLARPTIESWTGHGSH